VSSEIKAALAAELKAAIATSLDGMLAGHQKDLDVASTPTASLADDHDHDLNLAAALVESTPISKPTASILNGMDTADSAEVSVVTKSASHDSDLTSPPPAKCSTICPSGSPCSQSTACTAEEVPDPVTSLLPILVAYSSVTGPDPSVDVMLGPSASTLATTESASSTTLESDLTMAPPSTSYAVCLDPAADVPAAILTQAMRDIVDSSCSDALASMLVLLDKPDVSDTAVTHDDEKLMVCSSVEQPLVLVTARDVVDVYSFVAGVPAVPSATTTNVIPFACVVHEGSFQLTVPCLQPKNKLPCSLPLPMATPTTLSVPLSIPQLVESDSNRSLKCLMILL
jgi:hypothetical protein